MKQVFILSGLLLVGMMTSQIFNLMPYAHIVTALTMISLGYIMLEVGLEFVIDKKHIRSYGWDYVVAMTAAAFPWIFCAIYFYFAFHESVTHSLLIGRFASPTSAGILITMLAAAGLASTWVFKKVQVLAIFDDLDTILLMIPLKIMIIGFKPTLVLVIFIIFFLLWAAYKFMHTVKLPLGPYYQFAYGFGMWLFTWVLEKITHIHMEVLLPAFCFGAILYNPHNPAKDSGHPHEHQFLEPGKKGAMIFDRFMKYGFMFLVGCSLPKIDFAQISIGHELVHVLILTVISNIGKMFPALCYRKDASLKERLAVAIAMFPRGEVGAGVLLVAISYGFTGPALITGALSLALNLLLTGIFIGIVIKLIGKEGKRHTALG